MKEQTTSKRWLGSFCLINAIVLIISAARFLPSDDEYGAGWGAKLMAVVAILLSISFFYIALAMFWPKRYKSFWRWWAGG